MRIAASLLAAAVSALLTSCFTGVQFKSITRSSFKKF